MSHSEDGNESKQLVGDSVQLGCVVGILSKAFEELNQCACKTKGQSTARTSFGK